MWWSMKCMTSSRINVQILMPIKLRIRKCAFYMNLMRLEMFHWFLSLLVSSRKTYSPMCESHDACAVPHVCHRVCFIIGRKKECMALSTNKQKLASCVNRVQLNMMERSNKQSQPINNAAARQVITTHHFTSAHCAQLTQSTMERSKSNKNKVRSSAHAVNHMVPCYTQLQPRVCPSHSAYPAAIP